MGDYSREPDARLQESIEKHYVGVRLQQGVPLLDADWNELEDLRKHELHQLVKRFIGDGVPDGNDGFRIRALANGAVNTIILQVDSSLTEFTSLDVVLAASSAADRLGFLPGNTHNERFGSSPAQLTGDASEPFILADGLTLTLQANVGAQQTITFSDADFADIGQATAVEVAAILNANLAGITTTIGEGNDFWIQGGSGDIETAGRMLVEGSEILVENDFMFTTQPLYDNTELADLWGVDAITPLSPVTADRQDALRCLDELLKCL